MSKRSRRVSSDEPALDSSSDVTNNEPIPSKLVCGLWSSYERVGRTRRGGIFAAPTSRKAELKSSELDWNGLEQHLRSGLAVILHPKIRIENLKQVSRLI
uniref:Uncharacterized protein n=1 Tax=Ananas comosus var. bracteatus TaxID=296719 RepID=A0A6V7PQA6_ANACO|nr:unnamed protein product [Ananas comosus var. bracteatus]